MYNTFEQIFVTSLVFILTFIYLRSAIHTHLKEVLSEKEYRIRGWNRLRRKKKQKNAFF